MIYLTLFYEFFKTGLFAVGGGLATLPFLYNIQETHPDWFDINDLTNMIAVSQSTPGPLGVNMATYTGYLTTGVLGSILATTALVLPSLIIIIIIAHYLKRFEESNLVQDAFYGLRPAVAGLIAVAAYQVIKVSIITFDDYNITHRVVDLFDFRSLIICTITLILSNLKPLQKVHPIFYILSGAVAGIVMF